MALFNNWFSEFLKTWHWLCWAGESSGHTSTCCAPHSHYSVLASLCLATTGSWPLPHPSSLSTQGFGMCCFPCLKTSSRRSSLTLLHSSGSKVAIHSHTQLWQPFCFCLYPCIAVLSPQGLSLSGILHILFVLLWDLHFSGERKPRRDHCLICHCYNPVG